MPNTSRSAVATALAPLPHGIYLGDEKNGITMVHVFARGERVRCEPVPTSRLDAECFELERWLDDKYTPRPALQLVR